MYITKIQNSFLAVLDNYEEIKIEDQKEKEEMIKQRFSDQIILVIKLLNNPKEYDKQITQEYFHYILMRKDRIIKMNKVLGGSLIQAVMNHMQNIGFSGIDETDNLIQG